MIITDLDIAPGPDYTDPVMKKIMENRPAGENPDYWRIALRVVQRTKEKDSVNKDTPILVASAYHPSKSRLIPQVERRCHEAGVRKYIDLSDRNFNFDQFYDSIVELTGKW
ncbi:TPA: hypothetical protein HA242_05855 [Candidatus Woesearchaeota archaeon]|nr:hypothetical protein [Candidatus Woesearchaeota archaeon]HIG93498.1 hypothetical protein [Candidatus Woesearchaeota archaeon]HIH13220.1 hypothetical protein [Candidatus Woesearchaeota archaeon]